MVPPTDSHLQEDEVLAVVAHGEFLERVQLVAPGGGLEVGLGIGDVHFHDLGLHRGWL